jgi:phosphoribosyl-AMP cyclohydrolase / phosphoribosyl-ATP pyrophosphohydrolase
MIRPTIELRGGKVATHGPDGGVVLGDEDPVALARSLYRLGEVTVIDLDASLGTGDQLELIRQICRVAECRVGGGIRDAKRADALLRAGARQIVVGSAAGDSFLAQFPRARVVVSFEVQDGHVVRGADREDSEIDPLAHALRVHDRCSGFVYSLVGHQPATLGREVARFEALRARLPAHGFAAAGAFTSVDEVLELDRVKVDCQLTWGSTAPTLGIIDAYLSLIDFEKSNGLVPIIVQDQAGQVLSLLHANQEAIRISLETGRATYWSPVRGEHWTKGQSSGSTHELLTSQIDCDRDALVFVVEPQGAACHLGTYSCFGDLSFSLHRLERVLRSRQQQQPTDPKRSYTQVMLQDREGVRQKIADEAAALVKAESRDDVLWETADLVYFILLNLVREGISLDEVIKELRGRAGRKRK